MHKTIVRPWSLMTHRPAYRTRMRKRGWQTIYSRTDDSLAIIHGGEHKLWAFWDFGLPAGVSIIDGGHMPDHG